MQVRHIVLRLIVFITSIKFSHDSSFILKDMEAFGGLMALVSSSSQSRLTDLIQ